MTANAKARTCVYGHMTSRACANSTYLARAAVLPLLWAFEFATVYVPRALCAPRLRRAPHAAVARITYHLLALLRS